MVLHRRLCLSLFCLTVFMAMARIAVAAEHHGQVVFHDMPVPGATVIASDGIKRFNTTTDQQGRYSFANLTDGSWTIEVTMTGFAKTEREVAVAPNAQLAKWELKLLPLTEIRAQTISEVATSAIPAPQAAKDQEDQQDSLIPAAPSESDDDLRQRSADGLLINGSVNNSASSLFALAPTFGNNRVGHRQFYGSVGGMMANSALDARPFSITGLNTPKPQFSDFTGFASLGGTLKIRSLVQNDPQFFIGYQWIRNHDDSTTSVFVPTELERTGNFSQSVNAEGQPIEIYDPATGQLFQDNTIPSGMVSGQANALLAFYPLPKRSAGALYNYQAPLLSDSNQDAVQSRIDQSFGFKDQINGEFALQSARRSNPNIFNFVDTTGILGINTSVQWSHRFGHQVFLYAGYQFSRLRTRLTPWFQNRENVSGLAGITGNDQDPADWGPPSLAFATGIAGLSDENNANTRNQTSSTSLSISWIHGRHNLTLGSGFRREEFNYRSQQNPRGDFGFTGAATAAPGGNPTTSGSDFADFLLGIPDTSSIAYGNADKYFRESLYDEYVTDDWRVTTQFSVKAGVRWEYAAPITELFDRLVNLDIASGFSAVAPVVGTDPIGSLTGQHYPNSLIRPDRSGIEPRVGIAWRPISNSSLALRAGYGIYHDTSIYSGVVAQMAQQAPLSRSLRVENSTACPLTLADGFNNCPTVASDTFAVSPNFRVGYAQTWQLSIQHDLPGSLQINVTYLGTKGTHGMQEFLPNTYPVGTANPCPSCPVGFTYLVSGGNLSRQAGRIQIRRRLRSGLAASLQYTWSKSIDDDCAVGGQAPVPLQSATPSQSAYIFSIAQNWLNLAAERGLSTFDQRNVLDAQIQYTSGMGLKGGTLLSGWRGVLLKEWTFMTVITAGSGLPETPLVLEAVPGTGVTNTIRPDRTAAPLYARSPGHFLNPAAYTSPAPGEWGNARRNSIIGPDQFSLNASIARTFRLNDKLNLDVRIDSSNAINHVNYSAWNSVVTSPQFGLPTAANAMRTLQTTFRVRF